MFAMLDLNLKEVQNTNGPSVLRVVYRLDSSDETVMRILCQAPAVNRLTYITSVTWPTFNAYWVLSAFDWIMFCSIAILDDFVVISCSSGLSFWRKVTLRRDIMWNCPKLPSDFHLLLSLYCLPKELKTFVCHQNGVIDDTFAAVFSVFLKNFERDPAANVA